MLLEGTACWSIAVFVTPYNPYHVKNFDCHINVESCHNIKAVKYIYKYIYKGYNKGALRINQETLSEYNEINEYLSPPEAAWRIFGFPIPSHNVEHLTVHLPGLPPVYFGGGEEEMALCNVKDSQLNAWYKCNQDITNNTHNICYMQIWFRAIVLKGVCSSLVNKCAPKGRCWAECIM